MPLNKRLLAASLAAVTAAHFESKAKIMTDTKHTAAQPLDLDRLEALARAVDDLPETIQPFVSACGQVVIHTFSMSAEQAQAVANLYDAANPATIRALIAQARAAQPNDGALINEGTTEGAADTTASASGDHCDSETQLRLYDDALTDIAGRLGVEVDTEIATTASRIFEALDGRDARPVQAVEAVTRESALAAIDYVEQSNSHGRAAEARASLTPVSAQQAAAKGDKA